MDKVRAPIKMVIDKSKAVKHFTAGRLRILSEVDTFCISYQTVKSALFRLTDKKTLIQNTAPTASY